jgi:threonine dehydrogenase-like Zn-dependent dehydrogenase
MRALQFMADPEPWPDELPDDAPALLKHLSTTPMALLDLPDPPVVADDWVVLDNRLTGICGSDSKQVLMDFDGAADNMMTAFISFPQVLGHEVVATVGSKGPGVGLDIGRRVVLAPNLGCGPRGIDPMCPACEAGLFSTCWNFHEGRLSWGIHTGNAVEATGGFAERLPAHESMVFPVPDDIADEVAVLADPWSVAFHAITRNPPAPGSTVVVYGSGALGTTATAILNQLYPDVRVATIARWPAQAALARRLGAEIFEPGDVSSPEDRSALVEGLADWSGATLRRPWEGLPVAYPGKVDLVYDTVGSPMTVEVAMRVLANQGTLVQLGVGAPGRFEWTPWYFKELRLIGSNAFGDETFEGRHQHAFEHYFELLQAGRLDLSGMLTHRFRLDEWREAFTSIVQQGETGAIKVAFDFR